MNPNAMPGWQKDEPMTPNNDAEKALAELKYFEIFMQTVPPDGYVMNDFLSKTAIETIRTVLKRSAQVDGLVKALEFCEEEITRHGNTGSISLLSISEKNREAIQRFNGEV